jgi:hypothetical protein
MKRWLPFIAILVCVIWFLCLILTLRVMKASDIKSLGSYGQFGDVFGSVNALFTGLALIGLVYTLALQREQTLTQAKESGRQARERFLTARLNARIAMLQVVTSKASILMSDANQSREREARELLNALTNYSVQIDILASEVNLGFDGGVWSDSVEKEAIRQHIVNSLGTLVAGFDLATKDKNIIGISGLAETAWNDTDQDFRATFEQEGGAT